ncbi:MAG: DUF3419 family protein [Crocinitomicaceae bacterium]|nr:DUF3419 family protein [Crocinitomicaceae bacterium]
MENKQLEKVDFDIIRYANCWEDADVLLDALQVDQNSRVMSIASAGDNCFSLLSQGPEKLIAVDVSSVQLYLTELKKIAISRLDRESYLAFAGFKEDNDRISTYNKISPHLSEPCKKYWDKAIDQVKVGIIHFGKFEQYFQLFKSDFLHKIHSQKVVDELFRVKPDAEQQKFHDEIWHTEPWKEMYGFFFGEQMMGDKGRDPEFLKHVEGSVPEMIMAQEVAHLRTKRAQKNYFLYYILNNRFDEGYLPHYVRHGNYDKVKANIERMVLHHGLLDSATKIHPDCTHFNLSDIFEYMDMELFTAVSRQLIDGSAPHAKFAFWNLMVHRNMADIFPEEILYDKKLSEQLKEKDMGYFYRAFVLNQKK